MTEQVAIDYFAGHGWGVALQQLGVKEHAVEIMPEAIATRLLNGLSEPIYRDAWHSDKTRGIRHTTEISSPPCQAFSGVAAFKDGSPGRQALDQVLGLIEAQAYLDVPYLQLMAAAFGDPRVGLVLMPLHYASRYRPTYVVWEQVPSVLPIWEKAAVELRELGYSVWTGILDAADYGVPQVRKRAYLLARADGKVAKAPATVPGRVTMAEAIGWGLTHRPSPTITGHMTVTRSPSGQQKIYLDAIERGEFIFKKPLYEFTKSATTKGGIGSLYPPDCVNITVQEGAVLQSYPADFQVAGSKAMQQLQIGNAVPPLVAKAVLEELWT
jgi:DNA (cytosine-5)-methyltransferase 1